MYIDYSTVLYNTSRLLCWIRACLSVLTTQLSYGLRECSHLKNTAVSMNKSIVFNSASFTDNSAINITLTKKYS